MTIDDDIRAAFAALADRAPHTARVQQALAGAARARRQRRSLLIAGGVAAGTAFVGAGALAGARWALGDREPIDEPAIPTPSIVEQGNGNLRVPMRYRPGLLPGTLREVTRTSALSGPAWQTRQWSDPGTEGAGSIGPVRHLRLDLVRRVLWPEYKSAAVVDVNGVEGRLWGGAGQAQVAWPVAEGGILRAWAIGFEDSIHTALATADSVKPDGAAALEVPVYLRRHPAVDTPVTQVYSCSPAVWSRHLSVITEELTVANVAILLRMPTVEGAEPLTVRGLSGVWRRSEQSVTFAFGPVHDRFFTVSFARGSIVGNPSIGRDPFAALPETIERIDLTDDDALRIVEEMHIGPAPVDDWYGQR